MEEPSSTAQLRAVPPGTDVQRKRAVSLHFESKMGPALPEHDYVPDHLVSPIFLQGRQKLKGPLQRVVHDDLVDMGVVTASKHPSIVQRRQSDPGKISPALVQARLKYASSGSVSLEEDLRSRSRSQSPRRLIRSLPEEEETGPTSGFLTEEKMSPSMGSSPRRKLMQHRHSTCANCSPRTAGDESPRRRARTMRSNSLPMPFTLWPDRSALEVGEAVGALAKPSKQTDGKSRTLQTVNLNAQRSVVPSGKRPVVGRCLTVDETPLECILEESGSRSQFLRQHSAPQSPSPTLSTGGKVKPVF